MPSSKPEERVLILAPVGHDAPAMAELLEDRGFSTQICLAVSQTCREILLEAGTLLLTEEALELPQAGDLLEALKAQPSWSELPLIILTQGGESRLSMLLDLAASAAGGVTLLERPLSSATLLCSVEVALRSRRRQYQVRDLLQAERHRQRELEAANAEIKVELAERKHAEQALARRVREQTALYQFTDKVHRAGSLSVIYDAALEALVSALRCERAAVLLLDGSNIMRFVAWRGLSETFRKAVEVRSPWTPDIKDPEPIPMGSIETAELAPSMKRDLQAEGIQAMAFVPLIGDGKLMGKFMAYYDAPHFFTAEELDLALTLARQIGFGVERKRAEEVKARLAAIVECSEDAIISKDLNGLINSWNRGAERLFGFTAEEALGQPITLIIPPNCHEEEARILARVHNREHIEHFETVRRHKNGTLLDASLTLSPLLDARGKIVGVSSIVRDITGLKRARRQLQESEERYRTLVEQVKDYAIFRMDCQGRPTSWNEGVRRVLGFEEAEFIGRDISPCIFTPEDVAAGVPTRELQEAASTGTAGNDRWMRRKDGTRFYASGVTTGLHNQAGELVGYSKVLRDSTALVEARAKLQSHAHELERTVAARTKDLQATNEQLEAFVYSIAHDLRAPLRTITGYSQLLHDDYAGQLEETARHLLQRIHTASEFMDKLLLDLLAFGRTARAQIELGPVDVQTAWDAARFQCASQIEETQAQVETIAPLPAVLAHEATLGQCLANLLSNALKFVAPDVRPHIRFWAEECADSVRLWMQDNGLGIPADQLERVFRVFERLHGARYAGTGIGLSIVRKGVERMGGSVGVESELGQGSRFWLELPKAPGQTH